MHIQSGKAGGPDVSGATETNQAFLDSGDRKITCTGTRGEKHRSSRRTTSPPHFKTCDAWRRRRSQNGHVGWGDAQGNYHAGGKAAGQGAQIANYNPSMNKGDGFPNYGTAPYLIFEIGLDGNPITITFGEGQAA